MKAGVNVNKYRREIVVNIWRNLEEEETYLGISVPRFVTNYLARVLTNKQIIGMTSATHSAV